MKILESDSAKRIIINDELQQINSLKNGKRVLAFVISDDVQF
jgi:hypothetical protein